MTPWSISTGMVIAMPRCPRCLRGYPVMPHTLDTAPIQEWSGLLLIDYRYDCHLLRYFLWTIWYPLAFWMINLITTVMAVPSVLLRRRGARAVWVSPDRGVKHD